jgi:hypothetical protein
MQKKKRQLPKTLTWDAPEFIEYKKNKSWHIGFILISAALLIFAFYSQSPITIIAFVLLIIVSYIFSNQKPRQARHSITSSGIIIGSVLYPYKNIKTFWILYDPPNVKTLNFETTAYLSNQVSIELGNQDPILVKFFLSRYLIEDLNRGESLTDTLSRTVKF